MVEQVAGVGGGGWQYEKQGQLQEKVGAGGRAGGWGGWRRTGRRWSRVSNRIR